MTLEKLLVGLTSAILAYHSNLRNPLPLLTKETETFAREAALDKISSDLHANPKIIHDQFFWRRF